MFRYIFRIIIIINEKETLRNSELTLAVFFRYIYLGSQNDVLLAQRSCIVASNGVNC
jgi:hypothetical protein